MKNIRMNKNNFCGWLLAVLCLCATTLRAENMITKDLTQNLFAKAIKSPNKRLGMGNLWLSNAPGYKKVLTTCTDAVIQYADLDPEADVMVYLGYRYSPNTKLWTKAGVPSIEDKDVKVTVLENPKHGVEGPGVTRYGNPEGYGYKAADINSASPSPYYLGKDRVVYAVEVKGQKYKLIVNIWSMPSDSADGDFYCNNVRFGENIAGMTENRGARVVRNK